MDLSLIYREELLDHIKNPRNKGVISDADFTISVTNTSCGDEIILFVKIDKGIISDVKYTPISCAISTASASILSDQIKGISIDKLKKITEKTILENFYNSLTPSRQKCALLIHTAIQKLITEYEENKK